jgi:hypothetical protein
MRCMTLDREPMLAALVGEPLAARQLTLEWPVGVNLLGPPERLCQLGGCRIMSPQALMCRCLPHIHGHASDPGGQQLLPREVSSFLLYGRDDRGSACELVCGDLESRAHGEHAGLAQLAQVLPDDPVYRPLG